MSDSDLHQRHSSTPTRRWHEAAAEESDDADLSERAGLLQRHHSPEVATPCVSHVRQQQGGDAPRAAVACLFAAHLLARWAWRTWEFAVALILMRLFPSSLLLVSVYGVLDNLVRLAFGGAVGAAVGRAERLAGAVACLGLQNLCIIASAAGAAANVWLADHRPDLLTKPTYWGLLAVTVVAGASSSLGSLGASVATEREWPAAMAASPAQLSKINAGLRAIDLSCQLLAPVAAGLVVAFASMLTAVAVLGGYCGLVWLPECLLLRAARAHSPALRQPKPTARQGDKPGLLASLATGWPAYLQQPTLKPALALALLYLTVLSLGFLMTSWLLWRGMREDTLALIRGAGALSGLAATAAFHPLQARVGLVTAGGLAIAWQLLWLVVGVSGALLGSGQAGLWVLLAGLVASRFGLWLFDLSVTQLQQESVDAHELGAVSGVQSSLQSGLELASFLAGCALPDPAQFGWLQAGSVACVAAAAGLYATYRHAAPAT